jgi:hypothetical protein
MSCYLHSYPALYNKEYPKEWYECHGKAADPVSGGNEESSTRVELILDMTNSEKMLFIRPNRELRMVDARRAI